MTLSDIHNGEKAVISKVNGHGGFRKRLIEMGFIAGKTVKVILDAPLQDPVEYEILGYKISLRRDEARMIEVVSEEEARESLKRQEKLPTLVPEDCEDEDMLDKEMTRLAEERSHEIRVALVGNPNCGKTSLFNIASGSHEHVGNYSGVTVDAKEGRFEYKGYKVVFVDLPGTYSLSAYSPEELFVRKNLIDNVPDVVINVVDASNVERNLYLTTQVIDMNLRVVMALNMYDELRAKGDKIDTKQLGWLLGIPVCPTVSRSGEGIPELLDAVLKLYSGDYDDAFARHIHINHGPELERSIERVKDLIAANSSVRARYSTRYLAIKYLENDSDIERLVESLPNHDEIIAARYEEWTRVEDLLHTKMESAMVDAKYAFIQGAMGETYVPGNVVQKRTLTDRIDAVVTNRWLAFPIFLVVLYVIFWMTFTIGQYPMDWIEALVGKFGEFVGTFIPAGAVHDLVVDGAIAGVGSVLVFLPNILILYFFISLMEDSGYMARAAFIVDRLMHKIGLHGKSFIPMVMGFGCNVPAVMATRTIESRKARLVTVAIIPFMSCAGRLPIFVLLTGAFFPGHGPIALFCIYLLGVLLAILSAKVVGRFVKEDNLPFVMELPPYRVPTGKALWRHTWEKGKQYLHKMATTILIGSVIIWGLGYFPRDRRLEEAKEAYVAMVEAGDAPLEAEAGKARLAQEVDSLYASQQSHSYLGEIGHAVSPAFEPIGFDWRMDISLLTGVVAKELVVSSLGVMYSQGAAVAAAGDDDLSQDTALQSVLKQSISLPAAVAYMIFVLLYFPCIATFVSIKNETGKWSWAIADCAYTIAVAWIAAWIGFHIAALFV